MTFAGHAGVSATPFGNNQIADTIADYAFAFKANRIIGNGISLWNNGPSQILKHVTASCHTYPFYTEYWPSTDAYLEVKLIVSNERYYCWNTDELISKATKVHIAPNPFSTSTSISFTLHQKEVSLLFN